MWLLYLGFGKLPLLPKSKWTAQKIKTPVCSVKCKMLDVYMIYKLVLQLFQFLEIISSPSRAQGLPVDSTIVLKEG